MALCMYIYSWDNDTYNSKYAGIGDVDFRKFQMLID